MEFRIADTFNANLARLNGAEQKAVKTMAFDLQLNLTTPGLSFLRSRAARPKNWPVRVNDDIRVIVHRTITSSLLCYPGATIWPRPGPSAAASSGIRRDWRDVTGRASRAGQIYRRGSVSVSNGPDPSIKTFEDAEQESEAVGAWVTGRVEHGVQPDEFGVSVRSTRELHRARDAVKPAVELSD